MRIIHVSRSKVRVGVDQEQCTYWDMGRGGHGNRISEAFSQAQ